MARVHKYIKRTGTKGNYRYWYKLPDGRIVPSDDPSAPTGVSHDKAKIEHIKRLVAGKIHGHHSMGVKEMAEHVGVEKNKVTNAISNLSREARKHNAKPEAERRGAHAGAQHGHDFDPHHMKEAAHEDISSREYHATSTAGEAPDRAAPTAASAAGKTANQQAAAAGFRAGRGTGDLSRYVTHGSHTIKKEGDQHLLTSQHAHLGRAVSGHPSLTHAIEASKQLEAKHRRLDAKRMAAEDAAARAAPAEAPGDRAPGATEPADALRTAGFNAGDIESIMNGMEITTPGELEGGKTVGMNGYREEAKEGILNHILENKRNDRFEVGFKYLDLRTRGDDEGSEKYADTLPGLGFTKVSETGEGRNKKVTWKTADGVVFQHSGEGGGYSTMYGPEAKTKSKMKQMLDRANYVKDVNPYHDGLYGGMTEGDYQQHIAAAPAAAAPAAAPTSDNKAKIAELRAKLAREHGVNLDAAPAAPAATNVAPMAPAAARATAARAAQRASSPSSPRGSAARAIHAASPDLAVADEPITRMEEAAERGENPYLNRAIEIYHNIAGDLKPERKQTIDHIMQALTNLKRNGHPVNESNLVNEYRTLSGKRIRGISGIAEEFEKGTFMTLNEIMENKPVDAAVERMKRGYGAKQFARMKPFIKDSWHAANPSAPPPYPTFGDVKSWTEHGGPKPSWAGSTRLAMPQEVHEASAKKDGKPQYPPAWMPIHMMPAWNYVVKKAGSEGNPYQTVNPMAQGRVSAGSQARYQEGIAINALRKYVQMRGGPHQLVDIPSNKLSEVGLTHSDIFKAEDLSDATLKKLLKSKIVDSVELQPFLEAEMKGSKPIKKSFALVIEESAKPVVFKKSFTIDVKKAEIIRKIKELKAK